MCFRKLIIYLAHFNHYTIFIMDLLNLLTIWTVCLFDVAINLSLSILKQRQSIIMMWFIKTSLIFYILGRFTYIWCWYRQRFGIYHTKIILFPSGNGSYFRSCIPPFSIKKAAWLTVLPFILMISHCLSFWIFFIAIIIMLCFSIIYEGFY